MNIDNNCVVSIHYSLKDKDGVLLDSSENKEPLHYLHGAANIIPGLERQLTGKARGDRLDITVEPGEAYGERHDALVQDVPRAAFQGTQELAPGMRFQAETDSGPQSVIITAVTDEAVTVDANHPLAGETLHFNVSIENVRAASDEEVSHGHPHEGDMAHSH